eukprot:CAMPEP_0167781314 /NCGR_PEP_ID=MMETSP0111_2-20121227/5863_1 /TAXON_ID=91324 /ORGANISM="Lotharella globosa, Strain CCCM811" /LENGTH=185 /DNA_ID=CAMNT_0007671961 /DNA_START=97 /DNA_END=654 /DNA_ORIENTATION=+
MPTISLYRNCASSRAGRRDGWGQRSIQQRHVRLRAKNQTSSLDNLGALLGERPDGAKSTSQSLGALLGDRGETAKKAPKAGSVEALYEVAKQEEQSKEVSKEEAIRQVLRAPKKAPEKDKKEEPEYENFQEEIKDIGPKILSYAKALLVLPLTYWPYIVGLVAITALTVFLSDGSFGTRAPPMDM